MLVEVLEAVALGVDVFVAVLVPVAVAVGVYVLMVIFIPPVTPSTFPIVSCAFDCIL